MNLKEAKKILNENGYKVELTEALETLKDNGYICESNKHFEFWQYKLQVKKNLNNWIKTQKWYKNFDELRASISWELYIDIVKETMKDYFDAGSSPDDCADEIIEMAKEAANKG